MESKKYLVWGMCQTVVEADSLEEAMQEADELPLEYWTYFETEGAEELKH